MAGALEALSGRAGMQRYSTIYSNLTASRVKSFETIITFFFFFLTENHFSKMFNQG